MNLGWFKIISIILLAVLSSFLIWMNLNLRYITEWWQDKALLNILLFGPLISFVTYYYWGYTIKNTGSLWSARLISFSIGTITFAVLTWSLMGESPLTIKNSLCIALSILILIIQIVL